jgi:hypothetical protein
VCKIAAFCTSYNGVNVCVGFSLYIQSGIRGIYDVKMYYLLSSIFTGSHNCYKNVTFIFEFKQCFVLLFNLMQLSNIVFHNIVYLTDMSLVLIFICAISAFNQRSNECDYLHLPIRCTLGLLKVLVVFIKYYKWLPRFNWNIVESEK